MFKKAFGRVLSLEKDLLHASNGYYMQTTKEQKETF